MKIKRTINGEEMEIELTYAEEREIFCKTIGAFPSKRVSGGIRTQTKAEIMTDLLAKAEEMLAIMNPKKKWHLEYFKVGSDDEILLSEWEKTYHRIRNNDEYIMVFDADWYLLYAINVSANSAKWNMAVLFNLIGDKF